MSKWSKWLSKVLREMRDNPKKFPAPAVDPKELELGKIEPPKCRDEVAVDRPGKIDVGRLQVVYVNSTITATGVSLLAANDARHLAKVAGLE